MRSLIVTVDSCYDCMIVYCVLFGIFCLHF